MNVKKWMKLFIQFLGISGIGYMIDVSIYFLLTSGLEWRVSYSNMISAIPAITFVFIVSVKKLFEDTKKRPLIQKYMIYFMYQFLLLLAVSTVGQAIFDSVAHYGDQLSLSVAAIKMMIKFLITPITVICNFLFMRVLIEKL